MAMFMLLLITTTLTNAQTTYNPSPEPTDAPTFSPTLSPIICRHHGRRNETCVNRTITPTESPLPPTAPTSPTTPTPLYNGGHTKSPTLNPIEGTLTPTLPTASPTEYPLTHGRIDETYVPTKSPVTGTPTTPSKSPVTHDFDTNFPSKDPSRNPTRNGETLSPSRTPTKGPSAAPSETPSADPSAMTESPTLTPSRMPTRTDGQVKEPTEGRVGSGNGVGVNGIETAATDDVLLDLTSILLIVFGILICGILCGIFYYWYGRKRAVKRAQALQFRFNANRQMELDRVKSNTMDMSDKRTNLLMNMEHDGPIRVPEDEPGGIDTNDIVILSPATNDPALDMMLETKGGDGDGNQYLNVNNYKGDGVDVDEFDDNVTESMGDRITDNGMEINMNEDGMDDEVIDDIDNNDYVTAGGEDINMDETDEESK